MAEGDDDLERTEEPTSRRIDQAVEKGQVAFSKEVTSFLYFAFFALLVIWLIPTVGSNNIQFLASFIERSDDIILDKTTISGFAYEIIWGFVKMVFIPVGMILFLAFFSSFVQNGIIFSAEPLMPKLEKISVFAGIKRIFSMRSAVEFLKGLIKITVIGYITYMIIIGMLHEIVESPMLSLMGISILTQKIVFKVILFTTVMMMLTAIVDFLFQKAEYIKSLRMSRQELKEEFKQTEGNPEIKAKLRQIREARARRRMMAAVPKADVVIRNPTHYAIALEYKQNGMRAPSVVALGVDELALKIIGVAEESKVPVITNRTLAKALYDTCDLDEDIPIEHYKAVAEVIAYVYKLRPEKYKVA